MANLTDPLITSIQGTDPQNLMEYITRQKIYDCRFWKEECFGLTAADVLEKAAKSLTCIGGTFGGNQQPTKFLCLTLKLLQIQPEDELIQEFLQQDHFKYARALGAFYLRLTGRPADIFDSLEPLYNDFSKLKVRCTTEWKLVYMDEFIHELLTTSHSCGIALPRLPFRHTLQQEGYLEDGPRKSGLRQVIEEAGGIEEYLRYKVEQQKSQAAIALHEKRSEWQRQKKQNRASTGAADNGRGKIVKDFEHDKVSDNIRSIEDSAGRDVPRKKREDVQLCQGRDFPDSKKSKKRKYGNLFKEDRKGNESRHQNQEKVTQRSPEEGSEEYWNIQRAQLGLKPLK